MNASFGVVEWFISLLPGMPTMPGQLQPSILRLVAAAWEVNQAFPLAELLQLLTIYLALRISLIPWRVAEYIAGHVPVFGTSD